MKLIASSYQDSNQALSLFDVNIDAKQSKLLASYPLTEPSFVITSGHLIFTYTKNPLKVLCLTLVNNCFVLIDEISVPLQTLTHLAYNKNNRTLYGASYKDGAIIKIDFKRARLANLKVVNVGGKCHCVTLVNNDCLVTNIANDKLYLFDKSLNLKKELQLDLNIGPRHTLYKNNALYFVTEYSNELYKIQNDLVVGKVNTTHSQTKSNCATLLIDDLIYVSNRGEETISIFKDKGKLEYLYSYPTYGLHSRHMVFDLLKQSIISFNKDSNNITFIDKSNGKLLLEFKFDKASSGCIYEY